MDAETFRLLAQLKDPSTAQRVSAAASLGKFERTSPDSIAPLIEASQEAEAEVRVAAVAALVCIWRTLTGPSDDYWTEGEEFDQFFELVNRALKQSLLDEDKYVRVAAAEGLRNLYCSHQEVFDVFIAAAKDDDESLRNRAAMALWMGASDRRAPLWQVKTDAGIALLVDLLEDKSERVRDHALDAIRSVGLSEKLRSTRLADVLKKLLDDSDQERRFKAACALANSVLESQAALPVLLESLSSTDVLKRKAAAFALRQMGAKARSAMPDLAKGLKDPEVKVRARCAVALSQFGSEIDDAAIHALHDAEREAVNNGDNEMSSAVKRALTAIGTEQVEAAQIRASAYKARDFFPLAGFKPEEIPFWLIMLKDPDANNRARAATALGYLGAIEAIPDLLELLNDDDEDVRRRAADTLNRLGVADESAIEGVPPDQ